MATEEVRTMWVIFLSSGMVFGIAALMLAWIGSRVILSIRRQQKRRIQRPRPKLRQKPIKNSVHPLQMS